MSPAKEFIMWTAVVIGFGSMIIPPLRVIWEDIKVKRRRGC